MSFPEQAIFGPPSGPPAVPFFRPVLPEGLGNNLSNNFGFSSNVPPGLNNARSQDTSGHTTTMISETLVANRHDAIDEYEYVPLFVYGTDAKGPHDVYSLWHLNSKLREETLRKQTAAPRKTNRSHIIEEEFPTDIVEFMKKIRFAGYQIASMQQHPDGNSKHFKSHKRVFTIQLQGRLHNYPNVWGDEVKVGDTVAFTVKYVTGNSQQSMRNWDDTTLVDRQSPSQFLQVVPIICHGAPVATTAKTDFSSDINKHDCSSKFPHTIKFGDQTMTVNLQMPSVIIPVGVIQKRMGHPSDYDVHRALNTARGYENLKKTRSEVDIDLMIYGKRLKWGSVV